LGRRGITSCGEIDAALGFSELLAEADKLFRVLLGGAFDILDAGAPLVGLFAGVGEHLSELAFAVGGGVRGVGEDVGDVFQVTGLFEASSEAVTFLGELIKFVLEFSVGGFKFAQFVFEVIEGTFVLLGERFFTGGEFALELFAFFGDGGGDEFGRCSGGGSGGWFGW